MNGLWPALIFCRASSGENHAARSTSGKDCRRPLRGGHSISKVLPEMRSTSRSPSSAKPSTCLPPRLTNASERDQRTCRHDAELLDEFPARRRLRILAGAAFALGNRPGAIVLVAPERAAGMDQQHQQSTAFSLVQEDAGAFGGHSAPHDRPRRTLSAWPRLERTHRPGRGAAFEAGAGTWDRPANSERGQRTAVAQIRRVPGRPAGLFLNATCERTTR